MYYTKDKAEVVVGMLFLTTKGGVGLSCVMMGEKPQMSKHSTENEVHKILMGHH